MDPIAPFSIAPSVLPLAYVGISAVVPVLAPLAIAMLCAAVFVAMLTLELAVGTSFYSAVLFVVVLVSHRATALVTRAGARLWGGGHVLSFSRTLSGRASAERVGHKARNLALLDADGLPVPASLIVGATAFDAFAAANGLVFSGPDSAQLAEHVRAGTVPRRVLAQVHRRLSALASPAFLLRSSFADEDTGDLAFPGVYDSFEWRVDEGREALATVLKEVWASYWSERAVEYRARFGVEPRRRLAVLACVRVDHGRHGFAASLDVSTGFDDRHSVEIATPGHEHTVFHHLPSDFLAPVGASGWDELVDADLARRISRIAGEAEAAFGRPVEVEWGLADGELWIYQVRPLTALRPRHTFLNSHVAEMPRYPLTTLASSFLFGGEPPARVLGHGLARLGIQRLADDEVILHEGALYISWSPFRAAFAGARARIESRRTLIGLARLALPALLARRVRGAVPVPPPPSPPAVGVDEAELVATLRRLREQRFLPAALAQSEAVQAAALLESSLRRAVAPGPTPPPGIRTPLDVARERIALAEGEIQAETILHEQCWFLGEREAEISSMRAIDDPGTFLRRLGLVDGAAAMAPAPEPPDRSLVPYYLRPLVRARDGLLYRREVLNVRLNAISYEARLHAEALSWKLAKRLPGWEPRYVRHLALEELEALVAGELPDAVALAEERAEVYRRRRAKTPPPEIHFDESGALVKARETELRPGVLCLGMPLGDGTGEGPLKVLEPGKVILPEEAAGRVLVLPDPAPVWAAVAAVAAGVVFMRGGALSHLAMWCRERGIPTLIAVEGMPGADLDGVTVRVDTASGELLRA